MTTLPAQAPQPLSPAEALRRAEADVTRLELELLHARDVVIRAQRDCYYSLPRIAEFADGDVIRVGGRLYRVDGETRLDGLRKVVTLDGGQHDYLNALNNRAELVTGKGGAE